ncbi:MAG: SpoIIE family protein phosphatase [Lachnospiraceae bacterium]|nr:SpoIIE family protein phosphatase [Lachnospiraceae bacterium]
MLKMILQMSAVTGGNILISYILWKLLKNRKMTWGIRIIASIVFGVCAICGTHFGINFNHMMVNVRDMAPLTAGLFFDPFIGIIAGFIGGVERYIAGTYWGIGSYTRIACSLSTCLAGIIAALMKKFVFKGKKPSLVFAFFLGSTMEVFHMYVVLLTHRSDMDMAYYVVTTCAPPMIIFTGIGLAIVSLLIRFDAGEWINPRTIKSSQDVHVSQKFQFWLFVTTALIFVFNLGFDTVIKTQTANQKYKNLLSNSVGFITEMYSKNADRFSGFDTISLSVNDNIEFVLLSKYGSVKYGAHKGESLDKDAFAIIKSSSDMEEFSARMYSEDYVCMKSTLEDGNIVFAYIAEADVYSERDHNTLETILWDLMLFTVIYVLIAVLVQKIVVRNLELVNKSLKKITSGNLDEHVSVYTSSEFASLSDDINSTVDVLKTYISAAEKRIEQELEFAKNIQESSLPHNFTFPRNDIEIYASMDPAKEVGGDFYDFFFTGANKLCLVIADVSGKGIPAALFMMKSKTLIRSYAESGKSTSEILTLANNGLCEGNDADMFVTVWIAIIDLATGHAICSNAGHEYPAIKRKDGEYELFKEKHSPALATMEGIAFKQYELDLHPGDSLFVYTDGIPEALNENVKQYGTNRLIDALNNNKDRTQEEILKNVREDIKFFVGKANQFDDVTMLGFKYKETEQNS